MNQQKPATELLREDELCWESYLSHSDLENDALFIQNQRHREIAKVVISRLREARAELAAQAATIERQAKRIMQYENDEASVCPEDVGFVELIGVLRATIERLRKVLTGAGHALRSYQYGNSANDLAEECADAIEVALREPKEGA